jgi:hypothetical protein
MNITLNRKTNSGGKILEPGTLLDLPETKARRLIDLGIAREVVPETRIQKITRATNPDELVGAMSDYIPGQLSDSELIELTKAYELKMAEFLPDEWPETPIEQPTLPEASEPCLSGQNQGHPERITPHLGWNGQEVVTLPRCEDCQHFTRDDINPREGVGNCRMFFLPDNKRNIVRYPMQTPKNGTCFGWRADAKEGNIT